MNNIVSIFDLQKDGINKSIVFIDSDHANIHEGSMYKFQTYKTALAAAGTYSIYFTTETLKNMHLKSLDLWSSRGEAWADLYENLTATTTGGKSVVAYAQNRQATNLTSGITIKASATVTLGSAKFLDRYVAGGSASNAQRSIPTNEEWILKMNTKYGIRVTNKGTGTTNILLRGRFYTETENLG